MLLIGNTKLGYDDGGECLPPHAAPAVSDDDVVPVRDLSHRWRHIDGGETPMNVSRVMEYFSRA